MSVICYVHNVCCYSLMSIIRLTILADTCILIHKHLLSIMYYPVNVMRQDIH